MARKNTLKYQLTAAQSLSTSFSTAPTVVRYLDNCSYQINVATTNSIGIFQVEASNDYTVNETTNAVSNPGTWVALNLAGGTPTVSATDTDILIDLNQMSFEAIRLTYTSGTAGTGVCDIFVVDKQLGG